MKYLKNNQKLKIVPEDTKGITTGVIKSMSPVSFVVAVEEDDKQNLIDREVFEIIISDETCIISFETKVVDTKDNLVCFSMPENFKLIQRREYTRVDMNIPVSFKNNEAGEEVIGTTRNISGGGLKASASKPLAEGKLMEANFKIFNVKDIKTIVEVLRTEAKDDTTEYVMSGKFKEISNADRVALIQMCFKRQLELKCKGVNRTV